MLGVVPIWILFGIVAILNFDWPWLFLIGVAVVLAITNLVGYAKCLKDKRKRLQSMATSMAADYVVNQAFK